MTEEIVRDADPHARRLFEKLREDTLRLPGAIERPMWDGLDREWAPAFYAGERQLFHVHLGHNLGVTISINTKLVAPLIAQAKEISDGLRTAVAQARDYRGTKWVFLTLSNAADVDRFFRLVRWKHEFYDAAGMPPRRPRD